jgi:putative hydroxymethylpyrimidine transport system ATP-binding protein
VTVGICIKNASLSYREKLIFAHLNLSVHAGKWVALLGTKAVGKTAFLRMIAGQTTTDETVFYQQSSDNNLPISEQTALLTQNDELRPWLSLLDNMLLCLEFDHFSVEEIQEKTDLAKSMLNRIGLGAMLNAYPGDLTAFQRHHLALIRTIIDDKPIILMDEPFALLPADDHIALNEIAAALFAHHTVIFVTRNPDEALRYANEILVMHGNPVSLTSIASFSTPTPRELSDPQLSAIHSALFSQLALV